MPAKSFFTATEQGRQESVEPLGVLADFVDVDPNYEKAAEESGMYIRWMGDKMWAFGPAARIVQQHVATLKQFPPLSAALSKLVIETLGIALQEAAL